MLLEIAKLKYTGVSIMDMWRVDKPDAELQNNIITHRKISVEIIIIMIFREVPV